MIPQINYVVLTEDHSNRLADNLITIADSMQEGSLSTSELRGYASWLRSMAKDLKEAPFAEVEL